MSHLQRLMQARAKPDEFNIAALERPKTANKDMDVEIFSRLNASPLFRAAVRLLG